MSEGFFCDTGKLKRMSVRYRAEKELARDLGDLVRDMKQAAVPEQIHRYNELMSRCNALSDCLEKMASATDEICDSVDRVARSSKQRLQDDIDNAVHTLTDLL